MTAPSSSNLIAVVLYRRDIRVMVQYTFGGTACTIRRQNSTACNFRNRLAGQYLLHLEISAAAVNLHTYDFQEFAAYRASASAFCFSDISFKTASYMSSTSLAGKTLPPANSQQKKISRPFISSFTVRMFR